MRNPRWLLMFLIAVSAVALVVVPAWLWVEIPRWTAKKFIAAIEARDEVRANAIVTDTLVILVASKPPVDIDRGLNISNSKLVPVTRTVNDLIIGQKRMIVKTKNDHEIGVTFLASWKGVTTDSELLAATVAEIKADILEIDRAANKVRERAGEAQRESIRQFQGNTP